MRVVIFSSSDLRDKPETTRYRSKRFSQRSHEPGTLKSNGAGGENVLIVADNDEGAPVSFSETADGDCWRLFLFCLPAMMNDEGVVTRH